MAAIVIYHANCADGFGAAWVVRKFLTEKAKLVEEIDIEFYPGVYNSPGPDCTGKDVYIVDFSYKPETMWHIYEQSSSLVWIDHHKTAIEAMKDSTFYERIKGDYAELLDMNRSGAGLAWDYLFPERGRPPLIHHIEDRDLWRFALPSTREINANVFSYPYTFQVWDFLMTMPVHEMVRDGAAIMRKQMKDILELIPQTVRFVPWGNELVAIANFPYTMASEAGHEICKQVRLGTVGKGMVVADYAAVYYDKPGGRYFSLRSLDDGPDVSIIAKAMGGGGHEHAAGFEVPRTHYLAKV